MKLENLDLNKMYLFNITIYPEDKSKYVFQKDEYCHDVSGMFFANDCRDALEKVYSFIGVEFGKTICHPNVRHFVTEKLPCMNEDNFLCTGFSTR